MPRARDVAPRFGPPISTPAFLATEPGPRVPVSGLALTGVETPRAFGGFNQQPGDRSPRLDHGTLRFAGHHHRGPASVLRPPRAVAPFREVNDTGPVRAFCLPVARRCAPRWASRLTLDAPPECFESASTTDVSLTSTRRETTLSGDSAPSAVGKSRRRSARDPPGRGVAAVVREDAGPPRGHPASSGPVLDGTWPASGRGAFAPRSRAGRARSAAFSAARRVASRTL